MENVMYVSQLWHLQYQDYIAMDTRMTDGLEMI